MLENLPYDFSILFLINLVFSFTIIFLERKNPSSTLAWLLFLLFVPGAGFIIYLLLSQNLARRKIFKLKVSESKLQERLINEQLDSMIDDSFEFNDYEMKKYRDLIRLHLVHSNALFTQDNSVSILTDGEEKKLELLREISAAEDTINIMYYILRNDSFGNELLDLLKKKADEGVKVRLLLDSVGSMEITNYTLNKYKSENLKYAFFFDSKFKKINFKTNYRNHRKLVIIDGKTAFLGGFNIGNEYLGRVKKFGYWRDTHLKISGTAVHSMQVRFLLDWRTASSEDISFDPMLFPSFDEKGNEMAGIQIVSSGPDSPHEQIKQGYIKMISSAKKSIIIQTPYFIPDESILESLKIAALSGVDVKIMIPNKPDHPFVYWATYSYVGELLKSGVKIFTYENGFLHAKTIVIDEKVSSVGTANFDIRSFRLNFEINAFIYSKPVAKELSEIYEKDLFLCYELTKDLYYERPLLIKFKESIARLLSPLL